MRLKSILPNFNGISSSPAVVQALQQQLHEVQQAAEESPDLQAEAQCLQQSADTMLHPALHYSLTAIWKYIRMQDE